MSEFRAIPGASGGHTGGSTLGHGKVKWQVWAVGGLGATGVLWFTMKKRANSATPVDPAGIDPNTGLPFTDSSPAFSTGGTGPTLGGYTDPSTGAFIGSGGIANQVVTTPGTNAEWTQIAVARMVDAGYSGTTVLPALGLYLAGMTLTHDQYLIVESAIALVGYPPHPPAAPHVAPPTGQTTTPKIVLSAPVIHAVSRAKTTGVIAWPAVKGATRYVMYGHSGTQQHYPVMTNQTQVTLTRGYRYHLRAYTGLLSLPTATSPASNEILL